MVLGLPRALPAGGWSRVHMGTLPTPSLFLVLEARGTERGSKLEDEWVKGTAPVHFLSSFTQPRYTGNVLQEAEKLVTLE